jgi:hypothetical protein
MWITPQAPRLGALAGVAAVAGCLLFADSAGSANAPAPPGEYEVKAAFIVNFAGFVHWPPSSTADAPSTFGICVIGVNPFGAAFEKFQHRVVAGRALRARAIAAPASGAEDCQILFIGESEHGSLLDILKGLRRDPVLTVSDLEGFAASGGMMQLFIRNQKIRFEVNRTAAEAVGLRIDARLLKLAEPAVVGLAEADR